MAFGRGHASFTIETLKLAKDSLPAAVTESPPVFLEGCRKADRTNESINHFDLKPINERT